MPDLKKLTLESAAGGAAPELFEHGLKEVLENIKDPNCGPGKRELILRFVLSPREDRDGARNEMAVSCQMKTKLQPALPASSYAFISRKGGEVSAHTHDVHQGDLLEEPQDDDVTSIEEKRKGTTAS